MPRAARRPREDEPEGTGALDARKMAVLHAVVAEYIGTAQPVGSQHVANASGVNVSSATVRSEMAALEHEGYLIQPHTSAGRIPTDKGYRFFVDQLAGPGILGNVHRRRVSTFFSDVHGELEDVLEHASNLLADLTSYTAVVVGPGHDGATVRSLQLVSLSPRLALLVVVLSDGAVEKRSLEFPFDVDEDVLFGATKTLRSLVEGRPLSSLDDAGAGQGLKPDPVLDVATQALMDLASARLPEHVYVGGPSHLAVAFDAAETVRAVLTILEQQLVVVSLLREVIDRGLSVAIGTEHGYEPLASCAVVAAPVSVGGQASGAVGILGPTRMNYSHALAAAHLVSEGLGARIGDGHLSSVTPMEAESEQVPTRSTAPAEEMKGGLRGGQ